MRWKAWMDKWYEDCICNLTVEIQKSDEFGLAVYCSMEHYNILKLNDKGFGLLEYFTEDDITDLRELRYRSFLSAKSVDNTNDNWGLYGLMCLINHDNESNIYFNSVDPNQSYCTVQYKVEINSIFNVHPVYGEDLRNGGDGSGLDIIRVQYDGLNDSQELSEEIWENVGHELRLNRQIVSHYGINLQQVSYYRDEESLEVNRRFDLNEQLIINYGKKWLENNIY